MNIWMDAGLTTLDRRDWNSEEGSHCGGVAIQPTDQRCVARTISMDSHRS